MSSLNRISSLVASQLPDFIRQDHPLFVEFLEKYYEFLEQPGNAIYELKRFKDNYDVDTAREIYLKYFKDKILPSFPDSTELSLEKILKSSREFYSKKGTPDSYRFIFKALYDVDVEVLFPKLQILKASDGKWILPQAFRLSLQNDPSINLNLIEGRKAYGSVSRASCVIESAFRTIDKQTNADIVEVYVSNVNRLFNNGEYLEVIYIDENGATQLFSEKIIGAISNIRINPRRRGTRYQTGDPVVINGGLDTLSETRSKAVAIVGNVTSGSIESTSVLDGAYGFRLHPNTIIDIISNNGYGANVIVSDVDESNNIQIPYNTDAIYLKANTILDVADYNFDNTSPTTNTTLLIDAFSFDTINTYPIVGLTTVDGGSFFDEEPVLDALSLYESDYSLLNPLIAVPPGSFDSYDSALGTIRFVGASFSSTDDWYNGFRIFCDKHFRKVIDYDGATKTVYLNRPFEDNITAAVILPKTLYLDSRPSILSSGKLAAVRVLNGGTGYSATNTVSFIGTGYDATATLTVSAGVITAVNLTNRGEGYIGDISVTVDSPTGEGAILEAFILGDGEQLELDIVTGTIGQIRDIIVVNRGSDYVTTPNVSLKIYDLNVAPILESESILENDIVYQGVDVGNTTFRGTVDAYYPGNNILRVFNFSGSPSVGQNLVAVRAGSANVNTLVQYANVDGKIYPYRYGDGKAKATAEFLNGLIKYNGFYLNTDGHLSSDKKLQDDDKYHNFAYSLITNKPYSEYKKTVLDIMHPAGTKLVPIHTIKNTTIVPQDLNINVHILIENSNTLIANCNVAYNSNLVIGIAENFDTVANVNDLIIINSSNSHRKFAKTITLINNNNSLNIESPCVFIGEGRAKTNANNADIQISGNSNIVSQFIDVSDKILINVNNTVLTKTINSISGNVVTLNSNTGITTSNTNLIYTIQPQFNAVLYTIVKTDI